jgi:RNA polymerase sigma factor (sigma-70 family)
MLEDAECLQAIAMGGQKSREAIRILYDRYARQYQGFLRRRGCSRDDAEDLVQQVFMRLLTTEADLGAVAASKARGYLWTIVANVYTDWLRGHATQQAMEERADANDEMIEEHTTSIDIADSAPPSHIGLDLQTCFEKALEYFEKRNPQELMAIELGVIAEIPGKELALLLGKSYGEGRDFLHRTVKKLRKVLGELCHDYVVELAAAQTSNAPT